MIDTNRQEKPVRLVITGKYIKKMRGAKTLLRLDKYIILRTTKERHAIYKKYLQSRKDDRSGCILYEEI